MTAHRVPLSSRARWSLAALVGGLLVAALVVVLVVINLSRAEAESSSPGSAASADRDPADAPPQSRPDGLPADTALGVTELVVRDLDAVLPYYRDVIGLEVLEQNADSALLGREIPLLSLRATDDPAPSPADPGLYHTAFLYADEATLAEVLAGIAQRAPQSYQGSADHRVSLAFYFSDPEGNGVELYVDRPREDWEWTDRRVRMGSEQLDANAFIEEHLGGEASGRADIGHMHLKVADLGQARGFYEGTLGFDVVAEADGALFYSAGGYHHHVATNTWQTSGASPRTTTAGLGYLTITVPDAAAVDAVAARLDAASVDYETTEGTVITRDPWGNTVRISVAAPAA
jgi:catechol 2,3-dioxygenase